MNDSKLLQVRVLLAAAEKSSLVGVCERALSVAGYNPEIIPFDVLEKISKQKKVLVVVLIDMDLDGSLIKLSKLKVDNPNLWFIVLVSGEMVISYAKVMAAGAYEYICDPFVTEKLVEVLARLVQQSQQEAQFRKAYAKSKSVTTYFERVLANSSAAIGIMDRHGRAIRWNKAAEKLFGYSLQELKALRIFDLYADAADAEAMLTKLRKIGTVKDYAINFRRKDSTIIPVSLSVSLLRSADGTLEGSVGVATDMSRIKDMLGRLTEANQALQVAFSELNNELAEKKELLDRAKGTLRKGLAGIKDAVQP